MWYIVYSALVVGVVYFCPIRQYLQRPFITSVRKCSS